MRAKYGVAILIVTHLRKMFSDDPLDMISGSLGLSGGVDHTWVLTRERGRADAVRHVVGREVHDQELALSFDQQTAKWSVIGAAEEYRQSTARAGVLRVLREAEQALSPKEIADRLGVVNNSTLRQRLLRMSEAGAISSADGRYGVRD